MAAIIVHGIPGSPYLRSAIAACEEKGVAWRLAAMAVEDAKSPAHLARHPFGRIPDIEHGDFRLYETQAILRYVDALAPSPRLVPSDPRHLARMSQVMNIVDWYLFPKGTAVIGFERIIKPMIFGQPADEAAVAAVVEETAICLRELERLKGDQPFMAGHELSLADLMLAPHLSYLVQTPEGGAMLKATTLADWITMMEARPSFLATTMDRLLAA